MTSQTSRLRHKINAVVFVTEKYTFSFALHYKKCRNFNQNSTITFCQWLYLTLIKNFPLFLVGELSNSLNISPHELKTLCSFPGSTKTRAAIQLACKQRRAVTCIPM
jgi:hypothetical protein